MNRKHISSWCAAIGLAAATVACNTNDATPADDGAVEDAAESVGRAADRAVNADANDSDITVADIVGEPETYYGRQVTIEADVDQVMGPSAFSVDEDAPLAGGIDNDLLVLSKEAASLQGLDDKWTDSRVRVTGTVGRVDTVEIEREIDWDLNPEVEAEFEGQQAVLIADSVERLAE
ncbi:MAG: hypothetical protein AB7F99_16865 [Vicinamibacterales bacterium]